MSFEEYWEKVNIPGDRQDRLLLEDTWSTATDAALEIIRDLERSGALTPRGTAWNEALQRAQTEIEQQLKTGG